MTTSKTNVGCCRCDYTCAHCGHVFCFNHHQGTCPECKTNPMKRTCTICKGNHNVTDCPHASDAEYALHRLTY